MNITSQLGAAGELTVWVNRVRRAPLGWTLRNRLTWRFFSGWLATRLAWLFSGFTALLGCRVTCIVAELAIRVRRADGAWIDYGVVSHRVVTDAGVAFFVDDWDNDAQDITTFNYHGCGTDGTAENAADTGLIAESTTVLNPDNTRATGTKSQPAANQLRSTGTLTFDGSAAVVEHGLFSDVDTGQGTLWDRSVFAAINVGSGDSIQFQHTTTLTAGS